MSERGSGLSLPGAPAQTPGLPENFTPIAFEVFNGIDTKTPRPGIKDDVCAWMDGFMPIGPNNARVLPGTGPIINTNVGSGVTYSWIGFGNINESNFCYAVVSDGRVIQIDLATLAVTDVIPTSGIASPSSILGFSQWGSQYVLFAKDQENGYWIWDNVNLYTAGTIGPVVEIEADGSGYTSPPGFTVITTGSGTGVTLGATLENGEVTKVAVLTPGSGFAAGDFITVAASSAPGGGDTQAYCDAASPTTTSGGLSEVFVTAGGSGYTSASAAVSGGGGSGATISLSFQNGVITGAAIVNAGSGYTSVPTITVSGTGSGATVGCTIAFGQITSLTVAYGGTNYVSPPTVTIRGDGTGATAVATIASGAVTGITMTNFGSGYTAAVADLTGGNDAANVSVELMPFGISGTWIEVYEGHVWVGNGAAVADFPPKSRVIFTDPGSPVGVGNGGGAFESNDPFLRIGYHGGKQANGFLYLIGDSSLNYISNVQTSTPSSSTVTPIPTTTFGNLNVDPQLGSPWPSSIQVFSRNIVDANTIGVFVSYGGAVRKVSDPLDGFYSNGPIYSGAANFSAAVAQIFGIQVYMLLLPIIDPLSGAEGTRLLMWDGKKWWTSQQNQTLTYIATSEINSVLTAYGTDGTNIFPLFGAASTGFTKTIQSKLYSAPLYAATKTARSLSGIIEVYATDGEPITITVDSEGGPGTGNALITITPGASNVAITANGQTTDWTPPNWAGTGIIVFGPIAIGQSGRLIGLTLQTNASNLALLSLFLADTVESPNV